MKNRQREMKPVKSSHVFNEKRQTHKLINVIFNQFHQMIKKIYNWDRGFIIFLNEQIRPELFINSYFTPNEIEFTSVEYGKVKSILDSRSLEIDLNYFFSNTTLQQFCTSTTKKKRNKNQCF